jgi:DNA (cytosine-5)-methyltransferase 1
MSETNKQSSANTLTVLDLFCGAGGFSEGFRQQGFEIVMGIDHWAPAIHTFNHNFGLDCKPRDMLHFEKDVLEIEALPDTAVIVGSPPCVSFSMSNRMGSADKTLGVRLMKTFLRIIAVKRHKKNSVLNAWFMENVPNVQAHLNLEYTFADLGLAVWARDNNHNKDDIALNLRNKIKVLSSLEVGVPQDRKRLFAGEIIGTRRFPEISTVSYSRLKANKNPSVADVKASLTSPSSRQSKKVVQDPLYPISIPMVKLTDHFYDTGIHKGLWQEALYLKQNHPYMGKMSFPEDEVRPSRTIVASKIPAARESILYKSERRRKGNGEYRAPTVREAASIMSFPITYQFMGTESTKWKLVGNAVCPLVSAALASRIRAYLSLSEKRVPVIATDIDLKNIPNLNSFKKKTFSSLPKRGEGARFRRHPFKDGNMTVTMSNYDIEEGGRYDGRWRLSVMYGTGEGFLVQRFDARNLERIRNTVKETYDDGPLFIKDVANKITKKVPNAAGLQERYENRSSSNNKFEPVRLIETVQKVVSRYANGEIYEPESSSPFLKEKVPKKQLYALYALAAVCEKANR